MSSSPSHNSNKKEIFEIRGDIGSETKGLTFDTSNIQEEYSKQLGLSPEFKDIVTEVDALPRSQVVRLEHPDGFTMNSDETELYKDELDELNFEQDKFDPHKGGKGRSKGEIAGNHRPDPSGPTRKIVNNLTNNAKNQRNAHVIQHHSANHNAAVIAEAEAEALAVREAANSAPIHKKKPNKNKDEA